MKLSLCWVFLCSVIGTLNAGFQASQTADDYWERGRVRYERGDIDGAFADFSKAIELNPRFSAAYTARSAARRRKGDLDGALSDCMKAVGLNPKDSLAYSFCGLTRADRGEVKEAVADFTRSIELEPGSAPDYYNRAKAYKRMGMYQQSVEDYNTAIKLDPGLSWAYNNLAWLLATCPDREFRDGKKAIELAKKACELTNWQDPDMLGTLAAGYAEVGDFDEAIKWQTKALGFPDYDRAGGYGRQMLKAFRERKPYRENMAQ